MVTEVVWFSVAPVEGAAPAEAAPAATEATVSETAAMS